MNKTMIYDLGCGNGEIITDIHNQDNLGKYTCIGIDDWKSFNSNNEKLKHINADYITYDFNKDNNEKNFLEIFPNNEILGYLKNGNKITDLYKDQIKDIDNFLKQTILNDNFNKYILVTEVRYYINLFNERLNKLGYAKKFQLQKMEEKFYFKKDLYIDLTKSICKTILDISGIYTLEK